MRDFTVLNLSFSNKQYLYVIQININTNDVLWKQMFWSIEIQNDKTIKCFQSYMGAVNGRVKWIKDPE